MNSETRGLAGGFLLAVVLCGSAAGKDGWDGNSLYAYCRSGGVELGVCYGYVAGITHSLQVEGLLCPGAATNEQAIDVVTAYLEQNPSLRHLSAEQLVAAALLEAFSCDPKWTRKGGLVPGHRH